MTAATQAPHSPCTPISKLQYFCSHTLCEGPVTGTVIGVNENMKSHEL
jgi:hypothetical protein